MVGCWGCIQLSEHNLFAELLHKWSQLVVHKIPKVYLEVLWGSPTQVGVVRR